MPSRGGLERLQHSTCTYQANARNEDKLVAEAFSADPLGAARVFAVFDGHGGPECSDFLAAHLLPTLRECAGRGDPPGGPPRPGKQRLKDAVRASFQALDDHFLASHGMKRTSGACGLCACFTQDWLVVANAGDSRAILGCMVDGEVQARALTKDQDCGNAKECALVRRRTNDRDPIRPSPVSLVGPLRVAGSLMVTRAFGDAYLKRKEHSFLPYSLHVPYITSCPVLHTRRVDPQRDRFLVLATDGLYNWMSDTEVVEVVDQYLAQSGDVAGVAQHLINWVLLHKISVSLGLSYQQLQRIPPGQRRMYHDDITVVVVVLDPALLPLPPPSSLAGVATSVANEPSPAAGTAPDAGHAAEDSGGSEAMALDESAGLETSEEEDSESDAEERPARPSPVEPMRRFSSTGTEPVFDLPMLDLLPAKSPSIKQRPAVSFFRRASDAAPTPHKCVPAESPSSNASSGPGSGHSEAGAPGAGRGGDTPLPGGRLSGWCGRVGRLSESAEPTLKRPSDTHSRRPLSPVPTPAPPPRDTPPWLNPAQLAPLAGSVLDESQELESEGEKEEEEPLGLTQSSGSVCSVPVGPQPSEPSGTTLADKPAHSACCGGEGGCGQVDPLEAMARPPAGQTATAGRRPGRPSAAQRRAAAAAPPPPAASQPAPPLPPPAPAMSEFSPTLVLDGVWAQPLTDSAATFPAKALDGKRQVEVGLLPPAKRHCLRSAAAVPPDPAPAPHRALAPNPRRSLRVQAGTQANPGPASHPLSAPPSPRRSRRSSLAPSVPAGPSTKSPPQQRQCRAVPPLVAPSLPPLRPQRGAPNPKPSPAKTQLPPKSSDRRGTRRAPSPAPAKAKAHRRPRLGRLSARRRR